MRDYPVLVQAFWAVPGQTLTVDFDVLLENNLIGVQPSGWFIVVAGVRIWFLLGFVVNGRLICAVPQWSGPTTLADGCYHTVPPFEYATPEGWPVVGYRAAPLVVFDP